MTPAPRFLGAIACGALSLAGSSAAEGTTPPQSLGGVVRCAGSSTMLPLVASWGQQFHELHP